MARPRKSATEPDARQRMQDVFWQLLEDHQLREITVGIITAKAGCNRGTFYYHFRDLDDLIFNVIESELIGDAVIAENIFRLSAGADYDKFLATQGNKMRRISLLLNRGGMDMVLTKVSAIVKAMWRSVLCTDGSPLTSEAAAIIEYTVGGILSLIVLNKDAIEAGATASAGFSNFARENSLSTIRLLAQAQGISPDEVISRLAAVNNFMGYRAVGL